METTNLNSTAHLDFNLDHDVCCVHTIFRLFS